MADQSTGNVQIIVAVIGVVGVIATALFANWDKMFPPKPAPAVAAPQTTSPILPSSDEAPPPTDVAADAEAAKRMSAAQGKAYEASANALDDIARQIEGASAATIAGRWHDSDGYVYQFEQQGKQFNYSMTQKGKSIGTGAGSIEGRALRYKYTGGGNSGSCQGELASGDRAISGRCTDADDGSSWPFQIERG